MSTITKEKVILALDASTKATGWAIYKGSRLEKYGVITAGSANLFHRIDKMVDAVDKLIKDFCPDAIYLEEILPEDVKHNQNVFKALVYLQAFLMHLFDAHKIKVELVVASHWRKCCGIKTGSGVVRTNLKQKDIQFVKKMYNVTVSDDEADAICIGFSVTNKPVPVSADEGIIKDENGFEFG